MPGSLLFILCLLSGIVLLRRMPLRLTLFELIASGAVVGIVLGTYFLFLPVLAIGYRYGLPAGATLLLLAVGWLSHKQKWERLAQPNAAAWIAALVLFGGLLMYLNVTHDLQPKAGGLYSAGDTWGDIALHLTLASNFALTSHFSTGFPLLFGAKLTYPFLLDFLSGQLYRLGLPWGLAFVLPSGVLSLAIVQLLLSICYRMFGTLRSGVLSILLVLGSGSAAGWLHAGLTLHPLQDFSHIPTLSLQFTNLVTSVLLPQRGIAVGIAAVLLILLWIQAAPRSQTAWLAGLVVAALPLFHVHSWFVAELLLVGWAVMGRCRGWVNAALIGGLFAAPALIWQITNTPVHGFIHVYGGWMRAGNESVLLFWLQNFGLFLPLFIYGGWWLRKAEPVQRLIWLVAAGLFVLTNVLILQPNPYDNIKLLAYWYLFGAVLLAGWISKQSWRLVLLVPLCASGILSLLYDGQRSDLLVSSNDVQFALSVTERVPEGSRILTRQQHNDPVTMLSGRPVVEGYPGWLWTYGYEYLPIQQDVATMFSGSVEGEKLIHSYGVSYIEQKGSVEPAHSDQYRK